MNLCSKITYIHFFEYYFEYLFTYFLNDLQQLLINKLYYIQDDYYIYNYNLMYHFLIISSTKSDKIVLKLSIKLSIRLSVPLQSSFHHRQCLFYINNSRNDDHVNVLLTRFAKILIYIFAPTRNQSSKLSAVISRDIRQITVPIKPDPLQQTMKHSFLSCNCFTKPASPRPRSI